MKWFFANRTKRTTPKSSFEGLNYAQILKQEPELLKAQRQEEFDKSPSRIQVTKILPKQSEIDYAEDVARYRRAKASGYTKEEATQLVIRIRKMREEKREADAKLIAEVNRIQEAKRKAA